MWHIAASARAHDGHEPLPSPENETGAADAGIDALNVRTRNLIEFYAASSLAHLDRGYASGALTSTQRESLLS